MFLFPTSHHQEIFQFMVNFHGQIELSWSHFLNQIVGSSQAPAAAATRAADPPRPRPTPPPTAAAAKAFAAKGIALRRPYLGVLP